MRSSAGWSPGGFPIADAALAWGEREVLDSHAVSADRSMRAVIDEALTAALARWTTTL